MSRPRSGSPLYPSHRWEESNFGRALALPNLDPQMGQSWRPRRDHGDYDHFKKAQRRSPSLPGDCEYERQRYPAQEEFYHRRPSPRQDYKERGFSSHRDGGFEGNPHRGGSREDLPTFHNRSRSPHSPLRVQRERLPSETLRRSDFSEGPSTSGWRAEEQSRGREEFCPKEGHDDQRFPSRERLSRDRPDPHHKRSPPLKGARRDRDGHSHSGFRHEEPFGEQSLDTHGFGRDPHGRPSQGDLRHSGPLIIDHGHGISDERGPQQWNRADRYGDRGPDSKRHRSSSQEHFGPDNRTDGREEFRGKSFRNDPDLAHRDPEKNSQDRFYTMKRTHSDRPAHHRGHSRSHLGKGRSSHHRTNWHHKNPSHIQHQPRQQTPASRTQRDESYPAVQEEPGWADEHQSDHGRPSRPESLERDQTRDDLDPKMPRLWLQNRQNVNNPTTDSEETLTIKVDMSRPVYQESSQYYSADRQLSLDLVNVGRQRLDFLPMLKHSGTFRETSVHMGTFAEEIISLVHHVKEVYFKGEDVTLNQRFSAPQHADVQEEETEELTLNQRFSTNRGFHLDLDSLLDDDEPILESLELLQKPQRGPGDLRHNLERRRQERLEEVKVTIAGSSSAPQPLLSSLSGWISEFRNQDSVKEAQDSGPRAKSNMGQRRGFFRPNGPGRNYRRRFGPVRRQNNHDNPAGPSW